MRRRDFITAIGGAAATWPLAVRAQQRDGMRRIGVLMNGVATNQLMQSWLAAFKDGLRRLGWTEGQSLRLDIRWSAADATLARTYAAQLIGLMPDVILAATTINLTAIQEATGTVPVVFVSVGDPVAQGFVASLRQPAGNITGFSNYDFRIGGKWLELLKQTVPSLMRAAVMFNPDSSPTSKFYIQAAENVAPALGIEAVVALSVRATGDIEQALAGFARQPNGGLILTSDEFLRPRLSLIADLALRYRLASIGPQAEFPKNGGLMSFSTAINQLGQWRQAADYVDRILKGAKPGDLPVQEGERYTFGLNLKVANALGLELPTAILLRADEVIE